MFVVTGATGNTGSVVAGTLLAHGKPVTVVVRDRRHGDAWKAKGAHVAVADLSDAHALANALKGADGAYLLVPPAYTVPDFLNNRFALVDSIASAVESSGLKHAVILSSIGGHLTSGAGPILVNHRLEEAVGAATPNITVLRPAYFMENWASSVPGVVNDGILHTFLTAGEKIPTNSTADIGRIAAGELLQAPHGKRIVNIAGPAEYSPEDVAAAFSEVLGKPVRVQQDPLDAVKPALTGAGISADVAALLRDMMDAINSGRLVHVTAGTELRRGMVTPREAVAHLLGK